MRNTIFNGSLVVSNAFYLAHRELLENFLYELNLIHPPKNKKLSPVLLSDWSLEYRISGISFNGLEQLLDDYFNHDYVHTALVTTLKEEREEIRVSCNDYDRLLDVNRIVDARVVPDKNGGFVIKATTREDV